MSHSTYASDACDEWQAVVRCDGRTVSLTVRRRFGEQHTGTTHFQMESFQILEGDDSKCVFILPAGIHREAAKQIAIRTLPRFLGCSQVLGEAGDDAADVIFGVISA